MSDIKSKVESLLFTSPKPLSIKQLSDLLKESSSEVKKASDGLIKDYKEKKSGIQIIEKGSKLQMVSSPDNAKLVKDFIKDEITGELTRPSLEALTIIAYRGPIAKLDLDRIRGVNCALILRNLMLRGLVEVKKDPSTRSARSGQARRRETYYTITFDFMRFLGINELKELPDYERLSQDDTIDRILSEA